MKTIKLRKETLANPWKNQILAELLIAREVEEYGPKYFQNLKKDTETETELGKKEENEREIQHEDTSTSLVDDSLPNIEKPFYL